MSHRSLDTGLSQLNQELLTMGGHVERALECATLGWKARNLSKIEQVYKIERRVNRAHIEVDAMCVTLLALQQPLAADLRWIVSCLKINTDLERMVDLAVNIANNSEFYLRGESHDLPVVDLGQMSEEVRTMVREVLDAFVHTDEEVSKSVLERDDLVDSFKRKIIDGCVARMKQDNSSVEQALNVILIAKNLERIGDHATNIAEDIIYSASGTDIRHRTEVRS